MKAYSLRPTAYGLIFLVLAAAAPRPLTAEDLEAQASRLSDVKLEEKGELKVEAVRRRLGALSALSGSARDLVRSQDVPVRLRSHLALARAHAAFAHELFQAHSPQAARGEASRAFAEQVATTVERSLSVARAHLRSCVDLGKAAGRPKEEQSGCASLASDLGLKAGPSGDAAAIARSRLAELQPCFDARAAERPDAAPLALTATLSIDGLGRIDAVELSDRREEERALYDCLSDGLWIWTFPGVADVQIELPIKVAGAKR